MLTRNFELQPVDERVREAERYIYTKYGDICQPGCSPVFQFGVHPDVDPADSWDLVWQTKGDEDLPNDNLIDTVVSTDAGDSQLVEVNGMVVSAGAFTRVTQVVTLDGTTPVTLGTPLARALSIKNMGSADVVGVVTVEQSVAGDKHLTLTAVFNRSQKCAFTTASNEYFLIRQLSGDVESVASLLAQFRLEVRESGGVWQHVMEFVVTPTTGHTCVDFDPVVIVPPNSDIQVLGKSSVENVTLKALLNGVIATNV